MIGIIIYRIVLAVAFKISKRKNDTCNLNGAYIEFIRYFNRICANTDA